MAAEMRAVCSCGAMFPLPLEAFSSGMTCPGCGDEVTRSELDGYRPAGVTEFTRRSSVVILCLLVLGQIGFLARVCFNGALAQLGRQSWELGRSLPALTKLVLGGRLVPGLLAFLAMMAIGISVWALSGRGDPRKRNMGASGLLLTVLALVSLAGTLLTLAIRLPLIDLCRSLN